MASPFLFLARILHRKEFSAVVPKDINRINDGRLLRDKYIDDHIADLKISRAQAKDELDEPECSVLELIIGVADRLYFMYQDSPYEKSLGGWVHELLRNLKLSYMTDDVMRDFPEYLDTAGKIVTHMIERTYLPNGVGGLFPLKNAKKDQRTVEIWEQMMAYCEEKYDMASDIL